MAAVGRFSKQILLRSTTGFRSTKANIWTAKNGILRNKKIIASALGLTTILGTGLAVAIKDTMFAIDIVAHPPKLPWTHAGVFSSLDHSSMRRGYEVYKQVCSACHSINSLCYRNLVGVTHTDEEAKAEAADVMLLDGPDDNGKMFERPGKLSDHFPNPYPNEEAARAANNGALPPDMSYIVLARHGTEDYIFHILTGYYDPPAGFVLGEGQFYNPYFVGGALSMAQALYNEIIEYEDGTPATQSQLAKDVSTWLRWVSEYHHDERKRIAIKIIMVMVPLICIMYYMKRHKFTVLKNRKMFFVPPKKS